jgi:putative DNA methylase
VNKHIADGSTALGLTQVLNWNSRLAGWNFGSGGGGSVQQTFYNQALNTFFNYGTRSFDQCKRFLEPNYANFPLNSDAQSNVSNKQACQFDGSADLFVTDPPYGDAVKYEEILDFFIPWLRRTHPSEFADWVWDSRRSLAIKGEDEHFRQGMVAAYSKMTSKMPDNGLQIIMFTHQSGSLWADMANIVWASGLHVTSAWYVVTETDSPMRAGSYVKGTVLLVLRKQNGALRSSRDDIAWEIQEEVEKQVRDLTGLNQATKAKNRNENLFEDADLQMAGYAAALRVLTRYSVIDGRNMPSEAIKPRVRGQTTFVDSLIEFAVATANQALVPQGLNKATWDKLLPAERFILKMLDMEARGAKTLDNYQNFAKAFKVKNFNAYLG